MNDIEIRLRLIEAAAAAPAAQAGHAGGFAAGVRETAQSWLDWISPTVVADQREILGLPKKK